jgi:hypothetical protein
MIKLKKLIDMQIKSLLAVIAPMAVLFTSCLKAHNSEGLLNDKGSTVTQILEVGNPKNQPVKFLSLDATPPTEKINLITLQVFSPRSNSKTPVHVTLTLDPNLVAAQGLTLLPSNAYSGLNLENDIAPGASDTISITLNKNALDLSQTYGIGFRISSVSEGTISENAKEIVVGIGIKNQYDGLYSLYINTIGWGAYGIADNQPGTWGDIEFITTGPNTNIEAYQPALTSAGDQTGFGATQPQFTFDNATNKLISVVNLIPNDGRNRQFAINPNPPVATPAWNTFDPATHNLYLAYLMTQNGRPTQFIYETLTYLGPR